MNDHYTYHEFSRPKSNVDTTHFICPIHTVSHTEGIHVPRSLKKFDVLIVYRHSFLRAIHIITTIKLKRLTCVLINTVRAVFLVLIVAAFRNPIANSQTLTSGRHLLSNEQKKVIRTFTNGILALFLV